MLNRQDSLSFLSMSFHFKRDFQKCIWKAQFVWTVWNDLCYDWSITCWWRI